jgi:hypothetical protein
MLAVVVLDQTRRQGGVANECALIVVFSTATTIGTRAGAERRSARTVELVCDWSGGRRWCLRSKRRVLVRMMPKEKSRDSHLFLKAIQGHDWLLVVRRLSLRS